MMVMTIIDSRVKFRGEILQAEIISKLKLKQAT